MQVEEKERKSPGRRGEKRKAKIGKDKEEGRKKMEEGRRRRKERKTLTRKRRGKEKDKKKKDRRISIRKGLYVVGGGFFEQMNAAYFAFCICASAALLAN